MLGDLKSNVLLLFGMELLTARPDSKKLNLPHFVKIGVVDEHPFYLRIAKACSLNRCCLTEYRTQCLIERLLRADKLDLKQLGGIRRDIARDISQFPVRVPLSDLLDLRSGDD